MFLSFEERFNHKIVYLKDFFVDHKKMCLKTEIPN